MTNFHEVVESLASRLAGLLAESPATAWELKGRAKAPLSQVYMALGVLIKEGRIAVEPEGITYKITTTVPPTRSTPAGGLRGEGGVRGEDLAIK